MGLKCDLKTFYLQSILQLIATERKTGILSVQSNQKRYKIIIKEGNVVYAHWSEHESRIGNVLLREKLITEEALVNEGYISMDTLKDILYKQTEDRLYEMLSWEQGFFEYQDIKVDFDRMILIKMDIMTAVLQASKRVDEMSVINKMIPSPDLRFTISKKLQDIGEIKLNPQDLRVYFLIDKGKTVSQMMADSGYDRFTLYKIIYTFLNSGIIQKKQLK